MNVARTVLFLAPSAYLLSGLATWLDHLLPALNQRGWRAQLALVSGRHHHRPASYLAAHPNADVLIAHCDTETPIGRRNALEELLCKSQPDIAVSVNIPDLFESINRLRLHGKTDSRVLMSVHGIEHYLFGDMRRYRSVLDGVICTNRLACALSTTLGEIQGERVLYASYGVDRDRAPRASPSDDRLRIVYSGRLESAQKRCLDLVGIAADLRRRGVPYRLDIAGDGPDRVQLQAMFANEISAGEVVMHGFLPAEELRTRLYPSAHALIITSSWETGPIVAWEAMAQGLCVVSSRYIGSGREHALVSCDNALLFGIGDVSGAAASLEQLWKSQDLRLKLKQGGRHLVEQRYSTEVSADAWDQALQRSLTWKPVPGAALPPPRIRGRLDRWFGVQHAENLRKMFHRKPPPAMDAGGEWPHTNTDAISDAAFWQAACECDAIADKRQVELPEHVA